MPKQVNGIGPLQANLMIIGEFPDENDERSGIPFSGPSGNVLSSALKQAGTHRDECYITNVIKIKPPHNNPYLLGIPIESFIPQLNEEISKINPKCILLVGDIALKYVAGLSKITRWRGSIVQVYGKYKAVPCISPFAFLKEADWTKEVVFRNFDVKRAVQESQNTILNLPSRNLWVCKNSLELLRFLERFDVNKDKLSLDIESHLSLPICLGLSFNKNEAVSVPLLHKYEKVTYDQKYIWKILIEFFGDNYEILKVVGQNFKFDQYICNTVGINIPNPFSDTMLKSHTCYPELPKGLAFLTSIWTRESYYKDEGSEFDIKKHGIERLLLYNAKDAAVTLEVDEILEQQLDELGVRDFYYNYVMKLHPFYYNIDAVGFKIDEEVRDTLKTKYWDIYERKFNECRSILGHGFNPNSPKQCEDLFYKELKIPRRKNTKEETIQALLGNTIKDERRITILNNTLTLRQTRKTIGTYLCAKVDNDERMRTSYNIVGTETSRTSTSILEPPIRHIKRGWPFQQITKHSEVGADIRKMVIADEGYVLLEMDKAQAEARLAFCFAKDLDMLYNIEVLKMDSHSISASQVFDKPYNQINKDSYEREVSKHVSHAAHNGMGKHRFMLMMAGFGIMVSEKQSELFLYKYHKANPKIKSIFWYDIQNCIDREHSLTNPFGRKRQFFGRAGEATYKEAYAHIKQSTVIDNLRFVQLELNRTEFKSTDFNIVQEAHDAFLSLVPINEYLDIARVMKREHEKPINFDRCSIKRPELILPVDFKVGIRWSEMEKLKI